MRRVGNLPFVDVFLLLLITTLALINPPKENGKITPQAEMIISMEWHAESPDDVDLWIMAPDRQVIGFPFKDAGHTILHRDDLGWANDAVRFEGEEFIINQNIEVADLVKTLDGTYVVTAKLFSDRDGNGQIVTIDLVVLQPYHKAIEVTINLPAAKSEITAFTFEVKEGKIVAVDTSANIKLSTVGRP